MYAGSHTIAEVSFPFTQDPILYISFISMYAESHTIAEVSFSYIQNPIL